MLLLTSGLLQGWATVKSISDHLGIPKDQLYNTLKTISLKQWRNIFESCFSQEALQALIKLKNQSASSQSRGLPLLSIDDSVIRKWMGNHYIGKWFSGQFKKVVLGLDIVLVCLRIGSNILPLKLWVMSKRGPYKKRTERANLLIKSLADQWKVENIDLKMIAISMDAGYTDNTLIKALRSYGFVKIVGGIKGHYRVYKHKYDKVYQEQSTAVKNLFTQEDLENSKEKKVGL